MAMFLLSLLSVAAASSANLSASLAPWEHYLAPYVDDLVNVRESAQGRRLIFWSNVVDAVPTWLEDLFIPLFIPGSKLTIPINKKIPLPTPAGPVKIPLPTSIVIKDVTINDLNEFKKLRPLKIRKDAMFSWQSDIEMREVQVDVRASIQILGVGVEVTLSLWASDPKMHFLLIAAFRRTEMCETYGRLMFSSTNCAVWPMFVDAQAGKAGFKFEEFQVSIANFKFGIRLTGLSAADTTTVKAELHDLMAQEKPKLLMGMRTTVSDFLKNVFNELFLDGVDRVQKNNPCEVETWNEIDHYVDVSRVCIVNNGGFAIKFAYHNCPAHQYREASGDFPADVKECRDVKHIYPGAIEGQPMRAATVAEGGLHEILDPAFRYVPNSNVASWECGIDSHVGTFNYNCKLLSVAPVSPFALPEASEVCVINHAGFAMWFDVKSQRTLMKSPHSETYPVNQQKCMKLNRILGVRDGDHVATEIQAVGGAFKQANKKVVFRDNGLSVTFQCKGSTLDYSCDILTSAKPADVVV